MNGKQTQKSETPKLKFNPGQMVITAGINERMRDIHFAAFVTKCLIRHLTGDWGDLCREDREANETGLKSGGRLLSAYVREDLEKIWIITEWDRSVTTVLFPEEY